MENQNNQTNQTQNSSQSQGGNSNGNGQGQSSGSDSGNNQQEEMMKMLAAGYDMLQTNAARVPEMLSTAGSAVVNGVKSMSTTRKVIAGGVLAVGAALLVSNMRKSKGSKGNSSRTAKSPFGNSAKRDKSK